MTVVKKQVILKALATCLDPELGIDVVSLGLIYDIDIKPKKVGVTMTLTTPGCPLVPYFREEIIKKVRDASGIKDVDLELSFDPPWNPNKMSTAARRQLAMVR